MKKRYLILLGLPLGLIALLVVGPRLLDWNLLEGRIADAVRGATGLELQIDGDVEIALLPAIEFRMSGIRIPNPDGFAEGDLAAIRTLRGRLDIWPLLSSRIVVDELVVEGLAIALEVDETGAVNWSPAAAVDHVEADQGKRDPEHRLQEFQRAAVGFQVPSPSHGGGDLEFQCRALRLLEAMFVHERPATSCFAARAA